ncbi:hypothetical protein [Uliginosibacterium sediminicola]|uniref:DUF4231 domain-containing protein n=1 Tax=Uliginosibacterium sediminicola TaxID=2024550 RepID=A0ABU9YVC5_9RHOO
MNSCRITQKTYDELFKKDPEILKEALKQAHEIRKFEIELYWKRATYFWTFIGAAFVGYAAFFNAATTGNLPSPNPEREFILVLIACIGLVFSVAWHCVNKGSKFWQENWENHVELLEDKVFGPLYKTLTRRPSRAASFPDKVIDFFVAPKPFSVSKINQLVSTFVALTWALILFSAVGNVCFFGCSIDWKIAIPVALALATCAGFWLAGKSHEGRHNPKVFLREAAVNEGDA